MYHTSFFTQPESEILGSITLGQTVYVASNNVIKVEAVRQGLAKAKPEQAFQVIGMEASSAQAEQPMDNETLAGAIHRAEEVKSKRPQADWVIAIESGLFTQADGSYLDKAIVHIITKDNRRFTVESDAVQFPTDCVEEARRRGFQKTTASQIMQEKGLIRHHKDPHRDLIGTSRMELLQKAIVKIATQLPQEECSAKHFQQLSF